MRRCLKKELVLLPSSDWSSCWLWLRRHSRSRSNNSRTVIVVVVVVLPEEDGSLGHWQDESWIVVHSNHLHLVFVLVDWILWLEAVLTKNATHVIFGKVHGAQAHQRHVNCMCVHVTASQRRPHTVSAATSIEDGILDTQLLPVLAHEIGNLVSEHEIAFLDDGVPSSTIRVVRQRAASVGRKCLSLALLSNVRALVRAASPSAKKRFAHHVSKHLRAGPNAAYTLLGDFILGTSSGPQRSGRLATRA